MRVGRDRIVGKQAEQPPISPDCGTHNMYGMKG